MLNRYKTQLDSIDNQSKQLEEKLIEWANINTSSYNIAGIDIFRQQLIQIFSSILSENDTIEEIDLPTHEVVNQHGDITELAVAKALLIRKRPDLTKRVLLCGHMDTVFPKDHHFQKCNYLDENTINGPGVADMKGGILAMCTALRALETHENAINIGWDVLLTSDEEIGSMSSSTLFSQFSNNEFGMIYEPSLPGGEYVGERKGSGNFSIIVTGKASHAGRAFYDGKNAIVKLSNIISELFQLNDPSHSTTLNIGTIQGGQALNVVPDLAIAKFNIRVESDQDATDILNKVDGILESHQQEGYSIKLHGKLTRQAKPMDDSQKALFDILRQINTALNLDTKIIATGGCCDGNNFKALGLPNIDTLGVRGANIHSDQEYMLLDSLTERAKISALLLLEFAAGNIEILKGK